jgi:hypothetical protein
MITTLVNTGKYRIVATNLSDVPDVQLRARFACLMWDYRSEQPCVNEASQLSQQLIHTGCRYFVAGGSHCQLWEAIFDEVLTRPGAYDPEPHVMSTSHPGENEDDVTFFFLRCTAFEDLVFDEYLVVQAGPTELVPALELGVRRHALP